MRGSHTPLLVGVLWSIAWTSSCDQQAPAEVRTQELDVLGLGLERPHTGLVFSHADIDPCDDTKEGHFLSLGNGWILAAATLQQHFESLTCYLELEQGPGGWESRAVGLSYAFCVGRFWCEELSGTVTLDQSDPQELVVHAALRGKPLQHEKEYVQTFRVDLRVESDGLRRSLPRPRAGSGRSR